MAFTTNKLIKAIVSVFLPLVLISLFLMLLNINRVSAVENPQPQGQVGAAVNGKACETLVSQNKTEAIYQLNPELDSQEQEFCQSQIKELLGIQSQQEIANDFIPGEILVGFKDNPRDASDALQQVREIGLNVETVQVRQGWIKINLENVDRQSVAEAKVQTNQAIATILENEQVAWAEPNYLAYSSSITPTWGQTAIGVQQAWENTTCDSAIGVAVIDTGVDSSHNEFTGGNVFHGWDFINDDPTANDDNGHGTHVASTVAGNTVGICPGGTIIAYKALGSTGSGSHDAIASAIISATLDSRVKIINLSLGSFSSSTVIENAVSQAVVSKLVFSASGNALGGYPEYPALYPGVIPVGAIDWDWRLATFSTRFKDTADRSIVAPGVNVRGADYTCASCYVNWNGTSMATPHVAGSATLLWSADPGLTIAQLKSHLFNNTVTLGDSQEYGNGALHIGAAIKAVTDADNNLPPAVAWTMPFPSHGNPGEELSILALPQDLDGAVVSATAVISSPLGSVLSVNMAINDMELWEATFEATELGVYTASIKANDGISTTFGFGTVNLTVVTSTLPSGWSQYGQRAAGGSWIPYMISDTTPVELFNYDIGAANREMVAVNNGRGEVPASVRIVSSPACPLGNDYGRRWLFNPLAGISDPETITLSCLDGVGMFGNSAAISGLVFSLDEGSGRSDSQDSRLHAFDPWTGKQYWLIQLGYHGNQFVKTSNDGRSIYTVHGSYDALRKVDLMGRRQWSFHPHEFSSIHASPVEDDGRLFVRVDSTGASGFYALDVTDGSQLWKYSISSFIGDSAPAVSPDGTIVIFCKGSAEELYALRASDGQFIWKRSLSTSYCHSTPAVTSDYVIQYASGPGSNNTLYALDLASGEVVTSTVVVNFGSNSSSPAVVGDLVFLADYEGMIRAYRLPTLEKVWETEVDPASLSSWQISTAVGQDAQGHYCLVYAAGNNGYLRGWRFPCELDESTLPNDIFLPVIIRNE